MAIHLESCKSSFEQLKITCMEDSSFWLNAWITFNKQYWPDQSQHVMPARWSQGQFHPIQEMLRKSHTTGSRAPVDTKHNTPPRPGIQCLSSLCTRSTARCILMHHCRTKRLCNVQDSFGEQMIHQGKWTAGPTQAQKSKHVAAPLAILSIQLGPTIPNDKIAWFPI